MFSKLKEFFSSERKEEVTLFVDKHGVPTSNDLHLAATVLLVETARIDHEISRDEGAAVVQVLIQQFGITEEKDIEDLVATAVAAGNDSDGDRITDFIECLNESFSDEQRIIVLSMVWQVVLADNEITKHEERLVVRLRNQLRLSDEQGERAREMAEESVKRF